MSFSISSHRMFNGEKYKNEVGDVGKRRAQEIADKLRERGHKVRVTHNVGRETYAVWYR